MRYFHISRYFQINFKLFFISVKFSNQGLHCVCLIILLVDLYYLSYPENNSKLFLIRLGNSLLFVNNISIRYYSKINLLFFEIHSRSILLFNFYYFNFLLLYTELLSDMKFEEDYSLIKIRRGNNMSQIIIIFKSVIKRC
jgi:hypothetical protein